MELREVKNFGLSQLQDVVRETNRCTPASYRMDMIVLRSKGRRKYKSSLGRAVRMTRRKLKTPCGHVRNSRFIAPETELAIAFTPSQSVRAIAKTRKVSKDGALLFSTLCSIRLRNWKQGATHARQNSQRAVPNSTPPTKSSHSTLVISCLVRRALGQQNSRGMS